MGKIPINKTEITNMTETETKFCANCGAEITKEATTCPECGVLQQDKTLKGNEIKNPGIAAILSFLIAGAGQIYNGQVGKGIFFMGIQIINFFIMLLTLFLWTPVYLACFGYCIYDAYHVAQLINTGEIKT